MSATHRNSTNGLTLLLSVALLLRRRRKERSQGREEAARRARCSRIVRPRFVFVLTAGLVLFSVPQRARSQVIARPDAAQHNSEVYLDADGKPTVPGPDTRPAPHTRALVTRSAPATPAVQPAPGGGEMMVLDNRFRNNSGQAAAPVPAPSGH